MMTESEKEVLQDAVDDNKTIEIKKKNGKIKIFAIVLLILLLGIFLNTGESSANFAETAVNTNTFISKYEETMVKSAKELSLEEFSVKFTLASKSENRETYQINILDSDCGSIQLVCNKEGNIYSACAFSNMDNSIGGFIMINLIQTIHPEITYNDAEKIIASSKVSSETLSYNIKGNYAYAYFLDSDGLMLLVTTKDNYLSSVNF